MYMPHGVLQKSTRMDNKSDHNSNSSTEIERLDEEERKHAEYEQQREHHQCDQHLVSVNELDFEEERDKQIYITGECRGNERDEFSSRLFKMDGYTSKIDLMRPSTEESIFTYSNTIDYRLRSSAIGYAPASTGGSKQPHEDNCPGYACGFEASCPSANYFSISSRCQVAPERNA
ncbi:hypothetical protein BIW11_08118 [Tropilaelaps mercedesae]|uniref:Uncharacterized protein n=1 Tax=Tropilaelaps mercedesae TaxID=418985 RepID=A0A1V9XR93_9ACAR|nr:hypothetical protein BIW11_08118 [Tropilaelaps mercedesae]